MAALGEADEDAISSILVLGTGPGSPCRDSLPCAKSCSMGDVIFNRQHNWDGAFSICREAGDKLIKATTFQMRRLSNEPKSIFLPGL